MADAASSTSSTAGRYHVIHAGSRPRLALPAGSRRLRCAAARRMQPTSWKRSAFRRLVCAAVGIGLDRCAFPVHNAPLPGTRDFALDRWLAHIGERLNAPDLAAAVIWPPQAERGRIYVHLLTPSGEAVGFAKVSFDEANDALLDHEAQALRRLAALNLAYSHPPRVLEHDRWNGHCHLVIEAAPEDARPVRVGLATYPQPWVHEYAGDATHLDAPQVRELDWWQRFKMNIDPAIAFAGAADEAIAEGVTVCRVHGDYGGHNLLGDPSRPWILDWEHSHEHGPRRTDELRLWLGLNQALVLNKPTAAMTQFARRFLQNDAREIVAALAYLYAAGIDAARVLAEHWPAKALQ